MKKIVVKMRSFKKLFGGDLLQLALLLSLLKVSSLSLVITVVRLFINSFPLPTPASKNQLNDVKYYNEILPRSFFFIVFFSLVKSTECTLCSSHGQSFYRGLLLQVDPDNYLGYNPHSSTDPGGDIISGPAMLQDSWRHEDLSPRIHPKSMDSLLDIHQAEILEDLNSLGRYSRLVV